MIKSATQSQSVWAVFLTIGAIAYGSSVGGDQFGVTLLSVAVIVFVMIAIALISIREPVERAERQEISSRSFWPLLGAFSVLLAIMGFAVNGWYVVLAGLTGVVAIGGALGQAWREDIGWQPHFGDRLGERIVRPVGMPVLALVVIATLAISVSRVLLTTSEHTSIVIACLLAAGVMAVFALLSMKNVHHSLLVGLSVVAGIATISLGVIAAHRGAEKVKPEGIAAPTKFVINAQNTTFVTKLNQDPPDKLASISNVPANSKVEFVFVNNDDPKIFHNVALYNDSDGKHVPIWNGSPVAGGKTAKNTFVAPGVGTYTLHCDFHPTMTASVQVIDSKAGKS